MSDVVIEELRKSFGKQPVLPHFNLTIRDGEFVVLLGPSGCGKTTVLRCLAGLEQADSGRILIGGGVVEDVSRRISVPTQKRDLGFVFQNYALWPHMNVRENIAYPLKVRRTARGELDRKVGEALNLVGLAELSERTPAELSGGQQQRVALARALVASPRVLLLDEPLSNLDAQRRTSLRKELRGIHRETRTTTLYVTHDQTEALTMADRVLVMNHGRIEQSGTPRDVFERPVNRFVANFLGYENILRGHVVRASGRFLIVQSNDWGGELLVDSPLRPAPGSPVELAFRAANVTLQGHSREAEATLANFRAGQLKDLTYMGDFAEYTLALGNGHVTARVPAQGTTDQDDAPGAQRLLSIAPGNIVLLDPGSSNVTQLPVVETRAA